LLTTGIKKSKILFLQHWRLRLVLFSMRRMGDQLRAAWYGSRGDGFWWIAELVYRRYLPHELQMERPVEVRPGDLARMLFACGNDQPGEGAGQDRAANDGKIEAILLG
jgi:hypothetical protein